MIFTTPQSWLQQLQAKSTRKIYQCAFCCVLWAHRSEQTSFRSQASHRKKDAHLYSNSNIMFTHRWCSALLVRHRPCKTWLRTMASGKLLTPLCLCYQATQVTQLVVTEVRSTSACLFATVWRHLATAITPLYYVAISFHRWMWYRALKFGHHPHPLGYLCAKFCFFCDLHCWASPQRKIAYSLTQLIWCAGNRSTCTSE